MSISCESWFAGAGKASFTVAADGFSVTTSITDCTLVNIWAVQRQNYYFLFLTYGYEKRILLEILWIL